MTALSARGKVCPVMKVLGGFGIGNGFTLVAGTLLGAALVALTARTGVTRTELPEDRTLAETRERVRGALAAMGSGDPQPYIDLWAESDDVTLFGAWGPIEKGHAQLVDTFRWVGSRFKTGALVPEDTVFFTSGDLAYTVGFERGEVAVDDGATRPMTLRVTHIYRRVDDEWRLVHRHADFPPADQRNPAS
jgi:ketosteroid isomerase-like protein